MPNKPWFLRWLRLAAISAAMLLLALGGAAMAAPAPQAARAAAATFGYSIRWRVNSYWQIAFDNSSGPGDYGTQIGFTNMRGSAVVHFDANGAPIASPFRMNTAEISDKRAYNTPSSCTTGRNPVQFTRRGIAFPPRYEVLSSGAPGEGLNLAVDPVRRPNGTDRVPRVGRQPGQRAARANTDNYRCLVCRGRAGMGRRRSARGRLPGHKGSPARGRGAVGWQPRRSDDSI